MTKQERQASGPLVDDVRATRERLVRKHGGLKVWIDHLRKLQEQHPEKVVSRGKQAAHLHDSGPPREP